MQAFISDGETQTALQQTLAKMLSFQRSAPPTVGERALVGLAAALGVQFGAPGAALASAAAEIIHGLVASSLPKPDPVRRRRRR